MVLRRRDAGHSRQVRSPESSPLAGIAAERCAEVALLKHRLRSGMQVRERTRGGATRFTNIVNRERQRIAQFSASFAGKCDCADGRGSGVRPASSLSIK